MLASVKGIIRLTQTFLPRRYFTVILRLVQVFIYQAVSKIILFLLHPKLCMVHRPTCKSVETPITGKNQDWRFSFKWPVSSYHSLASI